MTTNTEPERDTPNDRGAPDTDPRVTDEYSRVLPGREEEGTVVLVGVVHDHPASTYRAHAVATEADPDVLALELPPLAVPLFRRFAESGGSPPEHGGEMTAAIQGARDAAVVGIDEPNATFALRLLRRLWRESVAFPTVRAVATDVVASMRHALLCWVVAALLADSARWHEVAAPVPHACDEDCSPADQAADESRHISRNRSLLAAVERPAAVELVDQTREETMASHIDRLRADGDVVAVVGYDHLAAVADRLS